LSNHLAEIAGHLHAGPEFRYAVLARLIK
jgi:hypothetical protein